MVMHVSEQYDHIFVICVSEVVDLEVVFLD